MKILRTYIAIGFLKTFLLTLITVVFILCLAVGVKLCEFIAKGGNISLFIKLFIVGIPESLVISIPVSVLTSAILYFGRLSVDGEIVGIKSIGLSIISVLRPVFLFIVFLTLFSLWLSGEIVPKCHFIRRTIKSQLENINIVDLIEEKKFICDFPKIMIYADTKTKDTLKDVIIYDLSNPRLRKEIMASEAVFNITSNKTVITLRKATVCPVAESISGPGFFEKFDIELPYNRKSGYVLREDDYSTEELITMIVRGNIPSPDTESKIYNKVVTSYRLELSRRLVLSLGSLHFLLLGVAFGISPQRKHSYSGMAKGLLAVVFFFVSISFFQSLVKFPQTRPEIFIWIPFLLMLITGIILINSVK